jgi:hypothetical protein
VGQDVADTKLRDIAAMLGRFGPPARVEMNRVDVRSGRQVIVLDAAPSRQFAPFVFDSRPHRRVGSTTSVMSQQEYTRLLLDRNHSRQVTIPDKPRSSTQRYPTTNPGRAALATSSSHGRQQDSASPRLLVTPTLTLRILKLDFKIRNSLDS